MISISSVEAELDLRSDPTKNDWEAVLFKMLSKNFGLKVNGESFLSLAQSIDFSIIRKTQSNQKNLGTIRSSNLCTEIMEYTSKDEVAVCNLASISLAKFVNEETLSSIRFLSANEKRIAASSKKGSRCDSKSITMFVSINIFFNYTFQLMTIK